jgi:hypothetical protein
MDHPIPKSVTLDQMVEAWTAFFAALGIPNGPNYAYTAAPFVVTEDAIYFSAVASADLDADYPEGTPAPGHPQGDEFAELACMVRIEIER